MKYRATPVSDFSCLSFARVESLSIRENKEESAFHDANNATGTPAVQQFNCLPQGMNAAEAPPGAATLNVGANLVNGVPPAANEEPRTQERVRTKDAWLRSLLLLLGSLLRLHWIEFCF